MPDAKRVTVVKYCYIRNSLLMIENNPDQFVVLSKLHELQLLLVTFVKAVFQAKSKGAFLRRLCPINDYFAF